MRYLFCDTSDQEAAEDLFIQKKVPDSLRADQAHAWEQYAVLLKKQQMPMALLIVRRLSLLAGLFIASTIIMNKNPIAVCYQNAPYLFWIGGALLLLAAVLFLIGIRKKKRMQDHEGLQLAKQQAKAADEAVRSYYHIPDDAVSADILLVSLQGKEEKPNLALIDENTLFRDGENLCLFNDETVFAFPCSELTGLRVVEQSIPALSALNWNKEEDPDQEPYPRYGVSARGGEVSGLRFFCALDIVHSGETYSLLFPAYELPVMEKLTGLAAPDLPAAAIQDRSPKRAAARKER